MNEIDELESLLDDMDTGEFEERTQRSRSVPTPSRRSSFLARQAPIAASQAQLQAATRALDVKIETLSNGVKALESRTNGIAASQDRTNAALRKESGERKRSDDAIRADLQQTKMLAVLLPTLTQETIEVPDRRAGAPAGATIKVVAQSQNQFASLLPFLLLMGGSSGDSGKGLLGGDNTLMLLLLLTLSKK